ncbi:ArsR family transcriptional regulator [Arthrobacter echini]|uniref:ArsR family transcriptional regulator n=1 Tax=Arthrobacter echini TaxID=1529066 RepID=A0A4S5EAK1_9MICC|nr:transcriptional regulator [Arthrobacter echini]THJ68623.1 ArsR family transcriptional regulator [Arthrobacter echini]
MSSLLDGLEPTLNQPKRLAAIAMIAASTSCDFTFLRDQLELNDSDLSRHMSALNNAGFVTIRKNGGGRGSTTTYTITPTGRAAYARHRETLTALLTRHPLT